MNALSSINWHLPAAGILGIFLVCSAGLLPVKGQEMTPGPTGVPPSSSNGGGSSGSMPPMGQGVVSPPPANYLLAGNDLVRINVFQEDDLTTETRVSKSGYINFPLIGPVHLAGKTVDEATEEIRSRLDKDYIINPKVTMVIEEYAKQWVTVLGEVQKPGQVEIPPEGGLDLLGAIAAAGGYTRVADPSHVIVRRIVNGSDVVLKVNAKQLSRDIQVHQFIVMPGDRINVGESIW